MLPLLRRLASPLSRGFDHVYARLPGAIEVGAFLQEPPRGRLAPYWVTAAPTLRNPGWQLVSSDQHDDPAYASWCEQMRIAPQRQRKQWEWVYILEVLRQHGTLAEGARGLGFGCGKEPISAIAAKHGCTIVATELAEQDAADAGWAKSGQYACRLEDLNAGGLCSPSEFAERVSFRHCDMNAIDTDLRDFDFVWSSCALEHLGGLKPGLEFIENAMQCLRPGGIAVHTTEFNLGSNDNTLDRRSTCIYRKRDIEALALRMLELGHGVGTLNFTTGTGQDDVFVDLPPYKSPVHLRLLLKRHLSTSIGLYVIRGH